MSILVGHILTLSPQQSNVFTREVDISNDVRRNKQVFERRRLTNTVQVLCQHTCCSLYQLTAPDLAND
uniref:Putative ovule protein n=1 Tax=Solanum chacoense TaxID=4108 RepID=A0A0V0GMK0_SOLCH